MSENSTDLQVAGTKPNVVVKSVIDEAILGLRNAYKPLLVGQFPSVDEVGQINRALETLARKGLSSVLQPLADLKLDVNDNGSVAAAYAVLANIAVKHAETAEVDARALMQQIQSSAIKVLTTVATAAISGALAL